MSSSLTAMCSNTPPSCSSIQTSRSPPPCNEREVEVAPRPWGEGWAAISSPKRLSPAYLYGKIGEATPPHPFASYVLHHGAWRLATGDWRLATGDRSSAFLRIEQLFGIIHAFPLKYARCGARRARSTRHGVLIGNWESTFNHARACKQLEILRLTIPIGYLGVCCRLPMIFPDLVPDQRRLAIIATNSVAGIVTIAVLGRLLTLPPLDGWNVLFVEFWMQTV